MEMDGVLTDGNLEGLPGEHFENGNGAEKVHVIFNNGQHLI